MRITITRHADLRPLMASKEGKMIIAEDFLNSGLTLKEYSARHGLAESTLFDYKDKFLKLVNLGIDCCYDGPGRPRSIDKVGEENLAQILQNRRAEKNSPTKRDFTSLVIAEATQTKRRKGEAGVVTEISWHTIEKLRVTLNIDEGEGQITTNARSEAESDPRNAYSMYCMNKAFCIQLKPYMIGNWDATQFIVQSDGDTTLLFIKSEDRSVKQQPLTKVGSGDLGVGIKMYHFHNAHGIPAIPVFVMADDSLDAEDFIHHKVDGLGYTNDFDKYGYVCFTKTRCCNKAFYRWYAKTIVVPFVKMSREKGKCKVSSLYYILQKHS